MITAFDRPKLSYFNGKGALRALLFYIAFIAVIYAPVVFSGRTLVASNYTPHGMVEAWPYGYDGRNAMHNLSIDLATASYFELPLNRLVGEELLSLRPPLWNPYQGAGTPLLAQYSTRAFFPYQLLEDISPVWLWDFFILGRLLVAGFFTFIFLRLLNLGFAPALLGGALYMFSGTFVWFINLEQMVNVAMCVPILLMCLEVLAQRGSGRDIAFSGASFALVLLGGQPETALYVLLLGGAYYLLRLVSLPACPGLSAAYKSVKKIIAAFVIGFLLASPLIVPFMELWANSHNLHPVGGDMGVRDPNPVERAVNIFTPTFSERPLNPVYSHHPLGETIDRFGKINYSKILPNNGEWDYLGGYTGMTTVFLALAGFLSALLRRRGGPLRALAFFFFIFGVGVLLKNFGVRPFLWLGALPLFDQVWSQRWAGPVWTFSLAVSAGIGLELLSVGRESEALAAGWPRIKALYAKKRELLLGVFAHLFLYWVALNFAGSIYGILFEKPVGVPMDALRAFVIKSLYLPCFAIFSAVIIIALKESAKRRPSFRFYAYLFIALTVILNALIFALGSISSIETDAMTRIGGADVYATINGATVILMALLFIWQKVESWSNRYERPYSEVVFAFAALMIVYALVLGKIVRFSVLKVPELRDFYLPSIVIGEALSVFFALLGLGLCLYLIKTGRGVYGIVALAVLELWYVVPRLYEHQLLYYKLVLLSVGLLVVLLFTLERRRAAFAVAFVFLVSFLWLDAKAEYGFPERYDPFTRPPYAEFLKERNKQGDYGRVLGNYGVLFPNFASSAELYDIRFVNSLAIGTFQDFRIEFLHDKRVSKETSAALWFTGRPELHIINERGGIDNVDVFPEDDIEAKLKYYSLLGVKYILIPKDKEALFPGFPLVYDKEIKVYENPSAIERAFFVNIAIKADNVDSVWWLLANKVKDLGTTVVLEEDLPKGIATPDVGNKMAGTAHITDYKPDRVVLKAINSSRAMLVLSDVFFPGWKALVDGREEKIYRVDGILRGVMVDAGEHEIEFIYSPASFKLGMALWVIGLAGIVLLLIMDKKRLAKDKACDAQG